MYCGQSTLVKSTGQERTAVSLRCRAWTCPDCKPLRVKQLIAEGCGGAPDKFLTLTSRVRSDQTNIQAAAALARAWRLVRLRLMRKHHLQRLPFLAVFEQTKAGWPHLHILIRGPWLDASFISECMRELIDSPIIKLQSIDGPGRVAGYVAKYCGEDSHRFGTSKRYWQSQDYDLRPDDPDRPQPQPGEGWERHRTALNQIVKGWLELGWRVTWKSVRVAEATIPP